MQQVREQVAGSGRDVRFIARPRPRNRTCGFSTMAPGSWR
jgi:hypothetical protein